MKYIASFSGGKDSLAMVLRIMEKRLPLDYVIFYDTGMEYKAIYKIVDKIRPIVENYGAQFVYLRPDTDFLMDMFCRPVNYGKENEHYGMDWCGRNCRWRTNGKITTIKKFLDSINAPYKQYIGIAYDEPERVKDECDKLYPLVDWQMNEADCLEYCYENGWNWFETTDDGEVIDLYQILDRVSCWCCCNKNLKELKNMYHYFYRTYWGHLKGMQSRIERSFKQDYTVFELEDRFKKEDQLTYGQLSIFDM